MTNRLILDDPQMADNGTGYQRQLAAHTWPGAEFRLLLVNEIVTAGDAIAAVSNMSLSLQANVRYYYQVICQYTRNATTDITFDFNFASGGNAPAFGDIAQINYLDSTGAEVQVSNFDPFTGTTAGTTAGAGGAYVLKIEGFFSCTTAGILDFRAEAPTNDGNDVAIYAGTHWVWQPIYNLAYESNP